MASVEPRELRKFGVTVGTAFAVFGLISWLRGHETPPRVLWTLAALLVAPALVAPSLLAPVQRGWMAFAHVLGYVNTRIILGLLFYLVFTPLGLVSRLFRDPLSRSLDGGETSDWVKREPQPAALTPYERQF